MIYILVQVINNFHFRKIQFILEWFNNELILNNFIFTINWKHLSSFIRELVNSSQKMLLFPSSRGFHIRFYLISWEKILLFRAFYLNFWFNCQKSLVAWSVEYGGSDKINQIKSTIFSWLIIAEWSLVLLEKNAVSNIEHVMETEPHKAAALRPPTTHHEKYQS